MKNIICLMIACLAASLAACAPGKSTSAGDLTGASATKSGGADVRDACKIVPKETVEKVGGEAGSSAELSSVHDGAADGLASLSVCTYKLTGGRKVMFSARRSPEDDNTADSVERVRKEAGGMPNAKIEDLPELAANRAFWVSGVKFMKSEFFQLHFFKGGDVYGSVLMTDFTDEAAAKTQAIKIAQAALSSL